MASLFSQTDTAGLELPTPDLSHFKAADYMDVYEPVEDSFLFLDALQAHGPTLQAQRYGWCVAQMVCSSDGV